MKPNNKIALLIATAIGTTVLIADFIMFFAMEAISGTAFGVTALISAPIAIISALCLIAPEEMRAQWKNWENANLPKQGFLPRTKESTTFEVASAIILACAWVITLATDHEALSLQAIFTVIVVALLVTAYVANKKTWSIWAVNNTRQLLIRARFMRILAVEIALFGMLTVCPGVNQTIIGIIFLGIAILSYILFFIFTSRAKGPDEN